jgi:hypothetical protein
LHRLLVSAQALASLPTAVPLSHLGPLPQLSQLVRPARSDCTLGEPEGARGRLHLPDRSVRDVPGEADRRRQSLARTHLFSRHPRTTSCNASVLEHVRDARDQPRGSQLPRSRLSGSAHDVGRPGGSSAEAAQGSGRGRQYGHLLHVRCVRRFFLACTLSLPAAVLTVVSLAGPTTAPIRASSAPISATARATYGSARPARGRCGHGPELYMCARSTLYY